MVDEGNLLGAEFVKSLRGEISRFLSHCMGGKSSGIITFQREEVVTLEDVVLINPELMSDDDDGKKYWGNLLGESNALVDQWEKYQANKKHKRNGSAYWETLPEEEQEILTRWRTLIETIFSGRSEVPSLRSSASQLLAALVPGSGSLVD